MFVVGAFVTKLIVELVHEILGHGLFVLLFGGQITGMYISVLWPYEFSRIDWSFPGTIGSTQLAWIYAGGILVCLCASFLTQIFLILKSKIRWYLALTLFWFAFWAIANSTGYLIIGGLSPFGDVYELIRLGVLTQLLSIFVGLVFFGVGFVALSWILRKTMLEIFSIKNASLGVTSFWFIIPALVTVMLANPERGLQVAYIPLTFIPVLLSFAIEYFWVLSKQKTDKNPDNVAK